MPDPIKKVLCPKCDKEVASDAEKCEGCGLNLKAARQVYELFKFGRKMVEPPEPEKKKEKSVLEELMGQ